jgi:hypothetical protein
LDMTRGWSGGRGGGGRETHVYRVLVVGGVVVPEQPVSQTRLDDPRGVGGVVLIVHVRLVKVRNHRPLPSLLLLLTTCINVRTQICLLLLLLLLL